MDPSDLWFQNAQPFGDYEDVVEFPVAAEQDSKEKGKKKILKTKVEQKKKLKVSSSYVITKAPKKALRMIKIEIYDISGVQASSSPEDSVVSAQYIVSEVVDEIMDMTDNLVNKISKKLCSDSCYDS